MAHFPLHARCDFCHDHIVLSEWRVAIGYLAKWSSGVVSIFPQREEILIGDVCLGCVSGQCVVARHSPVTEDRQKLRNRKSLAFRKACRSRSVSNLKTKVVCVCPSNSGLDRLVVAPAQETFHQLFISATSSCHCGLVYQQGKEMLL